jgi:hypothetical protein
MEHRGRIGSALWEFVWCLDKITEERDGIGIVLGGSPVKIRQIAADLDRGEHTVRRNLDRVVSENYISRTRTPYGFSIRVRNSQKFQIWSKKENVTNGQSVPKESVQKRPVSQSHLADLTVKNGRNKEDAVVDSTVDAAARAPASELWQVLGVRARSIPPALRELAEGLYAARNGQPMSEFVGLCMDLWADSGNKIPPQFAKAAVEIRQREKQTKVAACEMPELEAIPWGNK